MNDKSKQSLEKLNGVFYTPLGIVNFLSEWATENKELTEVLEPSAGDGRFVEQIVAHNKNASVTAIEINSSECENMRSIQNTKVINNDFYNFYENIKDSTTKYDIVIGNPPYIRYQYLTKEQREYQSDILKRNGIRPNKLINAWVAFTVACIELCRPGGKFAFVLPSDLLQVSYAKDLRKYIFKELEEVTIINFDNMVFSGIQQDVVLIFGIKRNNVENETLLKNLSIQDLLQLTSDIHEQPFIKYDFENSDKWRKFLLEKSFLEFYESKFKKNSVPITDLCKIEVGITTGNNKAFVVDNETVEEFELNKYVLPIVGRSFNVSGIFYNKFDLNENCKKGSKVWLLDFNNKDLNNGAKNYINQLENRNEHTGYKLSLRKKWYEVPSIWKPDAFLLRRIGRYPKIVKNEINATSTDTFHRVQFIDYANYYKILVLFYSSPTLLAFELEGRVFGGGALEILPGDMKNIRIPDIKDDINFEEIAEMIDKKLRVNEDFVNIVKWVDSLIEPLSDLTKADFEKIYKTWIALNKSRVN